MGFWVRSCLALWAAGQQGQGSPIAGILQQVLAVSDGNNQGVAAIISKFEAAGLGQTVRSWVGTGQNTPISADQIGQVFSQQQIDDAQKNNRISGFPKGPKAARRRSAGFPLGLPRLRRMIPIRVLG